MPRLADMLCQSVNNSSDFDSAWYVHFAFNLKVDIQKARDIFQKYGKGYIYAPGGFAMPDTPYQRRKMVANFGACVVVTSDGDTWVRTPSQIGAKNRKRAKRMDAKEQHRIDKLERGLVEKARLERMFHDCQGVLCPKRGGKANTHSDIGKYVNNTRRITMSDQEAWSMPKIKFIQISIDL